MPKLKWITLLSALLVPALLTTGCAQQRVALDYDEHVDFSGYRHYQWLEERSGVGEAFNPLLAERVQNAIGRALADRSLERLEDGEPDFLVRYFVSSTARTESSRARGSVGMGGSSGNVGLGVGIGFPIGGDRITQRAQIIIDFLEPESGRLTWRATRELDLPGDPERAQARVTEAVTEMLGKFPPR